MYTRIESRFWQDEKIRNISDDARYLMLYLLTSYHRNILGFYFLPEPYACFDLGWTKERFNKGLGELLSNGLIKYDETVHVVLISNFLKHNPLENYNQVKSAIQKLNDIPKTSLLKDFYEAVKIYGNGKNHYLKLLELLDERLQEPLHKPLGKPFGKQEEEKEEEEGKEKGEVKEEVEEENSHTHKPLNKVKIKYADYVTMTEDEYIKLVDQYGNEDVRLMIEKLDNYKGATGKRYKSDYRAILNWVADEIIKQKNKNNPEPKSWSTLKNLYKKYEGEENKERGEYP